MAHETILRREDCVLVLVDVQEKLLPAIAGGDQVVKNCALLLEGAARLGVPVIESLQYPKGLGQTVPELAPLTAEARKFEKLSFSCCGQDSFLDLLDELEREQVLLCGVETHVCVLQTALDLLEHGAQVHVAADAVGSRRPEHRNLALERLRREGAVITCAESALFEMLGCAGTDEFKAVAKLLR